MQLDDIDFETLQNRKPFKSDLAFNLNGLTADEYIAKVTDEINKIDLSSVPIDKWDMAVTFMLASLEVAGDFFIGDPEFKHSLANKNGPFCKWLKKFHDKASNTNAWWGHKRSALDYQRDAEKHLTGMAGDHRGKTFSHDLPLTRFLFGSKVEPKDSTSTKTGKRIYDGFLVAHDLLCFSISIYSLCTGRFVDFGYYVDKETGAKVFGKIVHEGYEQYNIFEAVVKYLVHMLADFCSERSLPIPGFSILTHIPNRDVEAFALKLYRNGMNLRTLALQSVPVGITELLMATYMWLRSKNSDTRYSEEAWSRKKDKLLLMAHSITTAVNVGKVIITKAPWRLNFVVIARTFQLVWTVIDEETKLTNKHLLKLDSQILRSRIESSKTLVLLDELLYETDDLNLLADELQKRMDDSSDMRRKQLDEINAEVSKLDTILED